MSDQKTSTLPLKNTGPEEMSPTTLFFEELTALLIALSRFRLVSPFGIQAFLNRKGKGSVDTESYRNTDLNEALLIFLYLGDIEASAELLKIGAQITKNTVSCICRHQKATIGIECLLSLMGPQCITPNFLREAAHWEVLKLLLEYTEEECGYIPRLIHWLFATKTLSFKIDYFLFTNFIYLSIGSVRTTNLECLQIRYPKLMKSAVNSFFTCFFLDDN